MVRAARRPEQERRVGLKGCATPAPKPRQLFLPEASRSGPHEQAGRYYRVTSLSAGPVPLTDEPAHWVQLGGRGGIQGIPGLS